jgi:hypothetical protein
MGCAATMGLKAVNYGQVKNWVAKPAGSGLTLVAADTAGTWSTTDATTFWNNMKKLPAESVSRGAIIAHSKSWNINTASHVVLIESFDQTKNEVWVIEAQGWDDEAPGHLRLNNLPAFTSSAECVVRHEYVAEYLKRRQTNGKSYVGQYWIMTFK